MHHTKYKATGNFRPFSTAQSYGMVINFPLTADICVLSPHLGCHYRFGLEIVGQIYTYSTHLL